ncbi:MAG: EVE domain-containing protein [Planctomycetota bacterium]
MKYWLVKSEPDVYSIDDLARDGRTGWDGVRNYQARNMLRDEMSVGDRVLFYHSNAKPPGVAGVAVVSRPGHPDPTQFDPKHDHHDPKADPEDPRWYQVEFEHVATFPALVPLDALRARKGLEKMLLLQRGQRLSVMPVTKREFDLILKMGG